MGETKTAPRSYSDREGAATDEAGSLIGVDYFRIARAVRCSSLTTAQRAVIALSLALRADPSGVSWPAGETIAGDTGMSRRGVQYVLLELEALGVIERVERPYRSQAYRIRLDRLYETTPDRVEAARQACRVTAHDVRTTESAPGATESAPGASQRAPCAPDQPNQPLITPDPAAVDPVEVKGGKRKATDELRDAVGAVWDAYRRLHPRCGALPPAGDRRMIEARVREVHRDLHDWTATAADVVDVIEAHHKAAEAAWFQGQNPDGKAYLGIETLMKAKGWSSRLELARKWREAGRPVAAREAPGAKAAAEKAWAYLTGLVRAGARGLPEDLAEKVGEDKAHALHEALGRVGGWSAFGRIRPAEEKAAAAAFAEAFAAAYTARVLG